MDTEAEELKRYEEAKAAHYAHYETIKPVRGDYATDQEYDLAISEWDMNRFCFAPNKPGYYRANND